MTELREVANIGARPHNPEADDLKASLGSLGLDTSLLMIKPGFYPNHPVDHSPIQKYAEGLLTAAGLDIICTTERLLSAHDVCVLYDNVMPPDEDDDVRWGVEWKDQLLRYTTSGPVFSYLLHGPAAYDKAKLIKNFFRNRYSHDVDTRVIRNFGHVPDPDDFQEAVEILMLDGMSADNLKDRYMEGVRS